MTFNDLSEQFYNDYDCIASVILWDDGSAFKCYLTFSDVCTEKWPVVKNWSEYATGWVNQKNMFMWTGSVDKTNFKNVVDNLGKRLTLHGFSWTVIEWNKGDGYYFYLEKQ